MVADAWNRAISETGIPSEEMTPGILKKEFGKTMEVIAADLFPNATKEQQKLVIQKCCVHEHDALKKNTKPLVYPGVRETIAALSGKCSLFIVSNCQSGYIELFLKKTETQNYMTDFECYGNTGKGKADNIALLMKRNRLNPEETVYVGDTQGDCDSAKAAGIRFVFAKYGFGNADCCYGSINGFRELLTLQEEG